jgi:hypothetical protein
MEKMYALFNPRKLTIILRGVWSFGAVCLLEHYQLIRPVKEYFYLLCKLTLNSLLVFPFRANIKLLVETIKKALSATNPVCHLEMFCKYVYIHCCEWLGRRYCYCYVHLSRNTANNLLTLPLIWGY